jgi:DNA-binding NarL/FixJ family response regulator
MMSKPQRPASGAKTAEKALRPRRVVLSIHQGLVRSGLRALLERIAAVEVRETSAKEQLLIVVEQFNPDVLLLEVTNRGLHGLEILKQVVQEYPSTRVLILTEAEDEEQAVAALRLGAAGLIAKSATSDELEFAFNTVASGKDYLPKTLAEALASYSGTPPTLWPKLTSRQSEVLRMMAEGHGTKEIALRLNISAKTVETHRARIKQRLNIFDIAGLVRYAIGIGLVNLHE